MQDHTLDPSPPLDEAKHFLRLPHSVPPRQVILDAGHPGDERNDRSVMHLRPEQVQRSSWCTLDKRKMEVVLYIFGISFERI